MKEIWKLLLEKGYEIHNKRVLGNPSHTSEESKLRDSIQEQALVCYWLRENYRISVSSHVTSSGKSCYDIYTWLGEAKGWERHNGQYGFDSPEHAIYEGLVYSLKNVIK